MAIKDLNYYTKKDFENIDYFLTGKQFNAFVVIPTKDTHDSGYRCMKFALCDGHEIVGMVGGGCDVIHLNGIGGSGKMPKEYINPIWWRMDCLKKSGYLRVFINNQLKLDDFIGSDFCIYATNKPMEKKINF